LFPVDKRSNKPSIKQGIQHTKNNKKSKKIAKKQAVCDKKIGQTACLDSLKQLGNNQQQQTACPK